MANESHAKLIKWLKYECILILLQGRKVSVGESVSICLNMQTMRSFLDRSQEAKCYELFSNSDESDTCVCHFFSIFETQFKKSYLNIIQFMTSHLNKHSSLPTFATPLSPLPSSSSWWMEHKSPPFSQRKLNFSYLDVVFAGFTFKRGSPASFHRMNFLLETAAISEKKT